jgi:hypothetical protein
MNDQPTGIAKRMLNLRPIKKGQPSPWKGKKLSKNYWTWAKKLGGPENFVEPMRRIFKINRQTPISLEFAIILKIGLEAARGDMKAAEMWVDRIYGKVPQSMDVSTTNNGPLVAIIQNVDVVKAAENMTEGKVIDVKPEDPSIPPQIT